MTDNVAKLDPNFAPTRVEGDVKWYDIRALGVEGQGWTDVASDYDRLPARAEGVVPDPVWQLSRCSTGQCVRFVTDATQISARWRLRNETLAMPHMPATGVSGLDLYGQHEGRWHFAGIGRPPVYPLSESSLVSNMTPTPRQFMLNLPLYNGVTSVEIGVPREATVQPAPPYDLPDARPICFYGTSINQGGCAARPGMTHTLILGRRMGRPTINLGFSGNGKSEIEVAELLAELDPSVYVLDPVPNMPEEMVRERLTPFVKLLRKARPATPIVLVESITYQDAPFNQGRRAIYQSRNAAARESHRELLDAGVTGLTFVEGDNLLGDDGEGTVDGSHPTDLGFFRMADTLEPVLRGILD